MLIGHDLSGDAKAIMAEEHIMAILPTHASYPNLVSTLIHRPLELLGEKFLYTKNRCPAQVGTNYEI